MQKQTMPMPSKFDQNKGSLGILPAGSIPSSGTPPKKWFLKQKQQQFWNNNKLKLLVFHGDYYSPSASLLSTEDEDEKDDTHTFCDPYLSCPVASCRELVLTVDDDDDDEVGDFEELALYNPSTKNTMTLPRPPRPPPSVRYQCIVKFSGLGLDPKSDDDDYKVLRYLQFTYEDENYHTAAGFMGYDLVELYSLKTDSWKRIPIPYDHIFFPDLMHPIYINGFNYWIAAMHIHPKKFPVIVSFDFAEESFPTALIPGPPSEAYEIEIVGRHLFLLAEFEGLLALVVYDKHEKKIELWVWNFDDRSWCSFGVWEVGVVVAIPLAFLKNHLFYFQDNKRELVVFDVATGKLKHFHGIRGVQLRALSLFPFLTRT